MKRPWMRFYTVGLGGIGVQTLVLTILKSGFGLNYLLATIIAVETAVLHNFYWHERWTWAHRNLEWSGAAARLARFNAGNGLIALVGNIALMWLFVSQLHLHYLLATGAAIGTCSLINYMVSDRLVFRGSADSTKDTAGTQTARADTPESSEKPPEPPSRRRGQAG